MSPIGRIFIVLNLVLAAAFLGWAANALGTTDDFKSQLADKVAELDKFRTEKEAEIGDLNQDIANLQNTERSLAQQRDLNAQEVQSLTTQLAEQTSANQVMQGNLTEIRATLDDYNNTIQRIDSAKDAAVAARIEAESERDDAVAQAQDAQQLQRDAEDAKREADARIADLEAEKTTLQDEVTRLDTHLAMALEITGLTLPELMAPPKIDAQVLDVRLDLAPGLVMLNVGDDQKVKRGYTFEIWRGGVYKGQARVADVQKDRCSALLISTVPDTKIVQGDRASTVL